MSERPMSAAFCGGAFGDEGKGRIVDEYVHTYKSFGREVIVYRDNGGANAGHTIELTDGRRVATHLLPSGILTPEATVILGKDMVIHPGDLMTEIEEMRQVNGDGRIARIMVDQMAVLSLDTHRAFESVQKGWFNGGKGSTERGISQSYADIIYRFPLRFRDLINFREDKIRDHYRYYKAVISGLGGDLENLLVSKYKSTEKIPVGNEDEFVERLKRQIEGILPYVYDVNPFLRAAWSSDRYAFIFEKAQAIGLDRRWGVYPDITASDTTFDGIYSSTEGIVNPDDIEIRGAVIKATYMSSVGIRELPTAMEKKKKKLIELSRQDKRDDRLAKQIRQEFKEYGASTGRSRDLAYLDIPILRFYSGVGNVNQHIVTHMDAVYPFVKIRVCTSYLIDGKKSDDYRPDQKYLLGVEPIYTELPTWSREAVQKARTPDDLPRNAKNFISFLENEIGTRVTMITTGPKRDQSLNLNC